MDARYRTFQLCCLIMLCLVLSGCGKIFDLTLRKTVDPDAGSVSLAGIEDTVVIRRDELGIPVIEARSFHDLVFAAGYAMASDRLAQMVTFSLLGQGRLSEMAGKIAIDMDIYIRTMGVAEAARQEYAGMNPEIKDALSAFSDGVNAYITTHRDRLPLDFRISGYTPEPWEPVNSMYIAHVFNLGLSFNLHEEIAFLNIAAALGPSKAAWLMPVYPDEPLPFEKAASLEKIDFKGMVPSSENLARVYRQLKCVIMPPGTAASNNWGIAPQNTLKQASIIANDTHLPLEQPSLWMLIHLKCPDLDVAGVAIAGVPGIVAGYNGHIAWGETMVMGDNQDVFIEQLKTIAGTTHYLYKGEWLPVVKRQETFKIKGEDDLTQAMEFTRHGALLNPALKNPPKNIMQPPAIITEAAYGLAVQSVVSHSGQSFKGAYGLMRAKDMKTAHDAIREMRSMSLNFIYGNADHIAWQVSGRYPIRQSGKGHLPSPGWTGEYDWTGYADVDDHPYVADPPTGYLYTANNRTIPPEHDLVLSSSWYAPERSERAAEMLRKNNRHTWRDSAEMHRDRTDVMVKKFQAVLFEPAFFDEVQNQIRSWKDEKKIKKAGEAMEILKSFDGNMLPESKGAAVMGIFYHVFINRVFADELGSKDSPAWRSFITSIQADYSPDQDHLLGRADSPFWDDVNTPETETKADMVAESLVDTIDYAEIHLGRSRDQWQWGRLLTYDWRTQTTQMKEFLPVMQRFGVKLIGNYTDRGPYAAGGSYNTLNVAGNFKGENFKVWLVPAMRMIVDFGLDEPMFLTNSGGQSGNPASAHYDDAIPVWLKGESRTMPFKDENIKAQYSRVYVLKPEL
jgi:acyl-homoserine-lactone acylase